MKAKVLLGRYFEPEEPLIGHTINVGMRDLADLLIRQFPTKGTATPDVQDGEVQGFTLALPADDLEDAREIWYDAETIRRGVIKLVGQRIAHYRKRITSATWYLNEGNPFLCLKLA